MSLMREVFPDRPFRLIEIEHASPQQTTAESAQTAARRVRDVAARSTRDRSRRWTREHCHS